MPSVRRCIKGCITFKTAFKFAKFGPKRQQWLNLLNVKEPHQRYIYACEHHFSESIYSFRRPMKNALPNQNLDKCFCNPPPQKKKKKDKIQQEDPLKLDSNTTSSMDVDEDDTESDISELSIECSSILPLEEENVEQERAALSSLKPITKTVTAAAEILVTDDNQNEKPVQKKIILNPAKSKDIETQLKATLVVGASSETHIKKLPVRRPPSKTPLFTGSYAKLLTSKISLPHDTDDQKNYPKLPVQKPSSSTMRVPETTDDLTENASVLEKAPKEKVTATSTIGRKSIPMMVAVYSFGEDTEFDMENYVKFPFQKPTKQHIEKIMPTKPVPIAKKRDKATSTKSKKFTVTRKPTRYAALPSTPLQAKVIERPITPLNTETNYSPISSIRGTPKKFVADLHKNHKKLDVQKTSTLNHDHSYTGNQIRATAGIVSDNTDSNNINDNIEIIDVNQDDDVTSINFVALSERGVQTDEYTFANSREYQQLLYIIAGLNKKVTAKDVEIKLNVIKQHVLTKELDHLRYQYNMLENEIRKKQQIINKYKLKQENNQVETTKLQHEQQIINNEDLNPILEIQNDSTESSKCCLLMDNESSTGNNSNLENEPNSGNSSKSDVSVNNKT